MFDKHSLIVVIVKSIQNEPYISHLGGFVQSATIKAVSSDPQLTFELKTRMLSPEQIRLFELLQKHGFTVVGRPDVPLWQDGSGGWKDKVIVSAIERMAQRYKDGKEVDMGEVYDSDFAQRVLKEIDKSFPNAIQTHEIKFALDEEPSDSALLTALAGLQRYGFIEGKTLFSSTAARRQLVAMANIEITAAGHEHLKGHSQKIPSAAVIHGDQINNYGNAGAIGRQSVGTVNQQHQWAAILNQVDLSHVATELKKLRTELMKTAKTPADYQQLGLVAEAEECAEKKDGPKIMGVLSKAGKGLFNFAKDVGAEITAKLISKAVGLKP